MMNKIEEMSIKDYINIIELNSKYVYETLSDLLNSNNKSDERLEKCLSDIKVINYIAKSINTTNNGRLGAREKVKTRKAPITLTEQELDDIVSTLEDLFDDTKTKTKNTKAPSRISSKDLNKLFADDSFWED